MTRSRPQPAAPASDCHRAGVDDTLMVLGIGNVLWADEGFGVRCVEALQQHWVLPPQVQVIDGGTQGLYLIQHVQAATHLLIFDAVDYGLAPGQILVVEDDDVPRFMGVRKMSLHQTGFQEVLMLARLTERYPRRVVLVGCQPQQIDDYGGSLTAPVRQAVDEALTLGLRELQHWGVEPRRRTADDGPWTHAAFGPLDMAAYEAGRPTADQACRVGDARFIPDAAPAGGAS